MGQVACRNLPWKGLVYLKSSDCNGRQKLEGIEWEKQLLPPSHA